MIINKKLLAQRDNTKKKLDALDEKIAKSFWAEYTKMSDADDMCGIVGFINQLPTDFKHLHILWQAAVEISEKKKLTSSKPL